MLNELSLVAVTAGFFVDALKIIERMKKENRHPKEMNEVLDNNAKALVQIIQSGQNVKIQLPTTPIEVKQMK
jgi:hypothetical protein